MISIFQMKQNLKFKEIKYLSQGHTYRASTLTTIVGLG